MYTEDYENRGFPFRDFLLKLILIILFVFLLVWLLPKFIKPTTVENKNMINEITAISSQIFSENLDKMKEAAISYYTDDRLPQKEGEYHQMTLSEMIGLKIITPLVDKNNKAVDVEKSYVKITKAEDEYILKVNIKDSEKEDYILVHLGCYTYCDSYVCEKKETDVAIKGAKPSADTTTDKKDEDKNEDKDDDEKEEPKPTKTYIYEYVKETGSKLSSWTAWGNNKRTSCSTKSITCNQNDTSCLLELSRYDQTEKIGTYDKKYVATYNELVQTSSYSTKTCAGYNYVIINNKTYTTTTSYKNVASITSSTTSTKGDWVFNGRKAYANPPRDTATVHYEFVGADYSYCNETCTSLPNFYYDKYTYVGAMNSVSSTTSTSSSSSSSVTASCNSYVTTEVPIYSTITKSYVAKRKEPLYGTVCYQKTRTRTFTGSTKPQYKWSSYNDASLLNDGWKYTGNKKLAN